VLLFIHGGGWQRGSKRAVGQKPLRFVAEGFVVVASNYRFRPQVEVPEMARDVAAAVAWIKGKIDEYGGNPSRIFLMGHSAGAHLTALVGTNGAYLESVGLSLADLGGVIPLDTGPYNVELQMKRVPPTSRYGRLMRSVFGEDAERWSPVSPWHHVKANAGTPPFLVFYHEGRMDAPVQAIPFVERLVAAGVEAEAVEAVGRTHGGLNRELGAQGDEPTDVVLAFLTAHGQLTGESQIARSITQTRSRMTMLGSIIRSVGIRP
jgi:acetyl esterase/lipase